MGLRRRRGRKRKIIMLKLSSLFMGRSRSRQRREMSSNRKRKREGIDGNLCADMLNPNIDGIDKLSDDLLVSILSRMSLKEAARTSALSRRWKYLWRLFSGTLQFDFSGFNDTTELGKFESWVNNVLELHQGPYIEGIVINFTFKGMPVHYSVSTRMARVIDSWVYSAVQKDVRRLELNLPREYEFPSIEMLVSHSQGMSKTSPFHSLRTLRLFAVEIKDEVVHYFLASCPNLEELCIHHSMVTKNIQVVDPPSLRVLEINRCFRIQSLELSADKLVSLAYDGCRTGLLLKKIPNLRELCISDDLYLSFVSEPEEHSFYSDQLVKLVVDHQLPFLGYNGSVVTNYMGQLSSLRRLEVQVFSAVGRSLIFFTSMINASPQLCEFRIEISYPVFDYSELCAFPEIIGEDAVKFDHKSLKVVEMCGFVGCWSEEELLREVLENAPLIERVSIDTKSGYYDDPDWAHVRMRERIGRPVSLMKGATTRAESEQRASNLVSTLPHQIQFIIT